MRLIACLSFLGFALCSSSLTGQEVTGQEKAASEISEMVRHIAFKTPVPERFSSAQAIRGTEQGKDTALHAVFEDPDNGDRLHLFTETGFDRTLNAARRGAAKAYYNGTLEMYANAGFKLLEVEPKDLRENFNNFDFSKDMKVMFTFKNPEGGIQYVKLRIFFTNFGFSVGIHSNDLDRVKALDEFMDGLSPKAK